VVPNIIKRPLSNDQWRNEAQFTGTDYDMMKLLGSYTIVTRWLGKPMTKYRFF